MPRLAILALVFVAALDDVLEEPDR